MTGPSQRIRAAHYDRIVAVADAESAFVGQQLVAVLPANEHWVAAAEHLAARLGLPTNEPASLPARLIKDRMVAAVAEAGLSAPRQIAARSAEEILGWSRALGLEAVVVKPPASLSSRGVSRAAGEVALREAFVRAAEVALRRTGAEHLYVVAQELVEGPEYYINAVSRDGRHRFVEVFRAPKRLVGGSPFAYDRFDLMPWDAPVAERLRAYVAKVLDAIGVRNGASHTEVRLGPSGPTLLESGARMDGLTTAAVTRACLGTSVPDLLAQAFCDPESFYRDVHEPLHPRKWCSHVAVTHPHGGIVRANRARERLGALDSFAAWLEYYRPGDDLPAPSGAWTLLGTCTLVSANPVAIQADVEALREWEAQGDLADVFEPDAADLVHRIAHAREPRGLSSWRAVLPEEAVSIECDGGAAFASARGAPYVYAAAPRSDLAALREVAEAAGRPLLVLPPLVWRLREGDAETVIDARGPALRATLLLPALGLVEVGGEPSARWVVDSRVAWAGLAMGQHARVEPSTRLPGAIRLRVAPLDGPEAAVELSVVDGVAWAIGFESPGGAPEALSRALLAYLRDEGLVACVLGEVGLPGAESLAPGTRALRILWPQPVRVRTSSEWRALAVGLPSEPAPEHAVVARFRTRRPVHQSPGYAASVIWRGVHAALVGNALVYTMAQAGTKLLLAPFVNHLDMAALRAYVAAERVDIALVQPHLQVELRDGARRQRMSFHAEHPEPWLEGLAAFGLVPTEAMPYHTRTALLDLSVAEEQWHLGASSNVRRQLKLAEKGGVRFDAKAFGEMTTADLHALDALAVEWLEATDLLRPDGRRVAASYIAAMGDEGRVVRAFQGDELLGAWVLLMHAGVASMQVTWRTPLGDTLGTSGALVFECMRVARDLGCDVMDLHGAFDPRFPHVHEDWKGYSEHKRRLGAHFVSLAPVMRIVGT